MQVVSSLSPSSAQRARALLGIPVLSIFDVPGAAAVKASANPDWGPIFQAAMLTGHKYYVPPGEYVFRTKARVVTSKSVFLEMAPGAVIVQHEDMLGFSGALIEIEGATSPVDGGIITDDSVNPNTPNPLRRVSCVLTNMTFSQQRVTNFANKDPNNRFVVVSDDGNIEGTKCLDLALLYKPVVEGGYFFGGRTRPNDNNPLGLGCGDTGIDVHGCVDGVIKDVLFEGFYDLGVYDNGVQPRTNVTNPFSVVAGVTDVRVDWVGHGMAVGDTFSISTFAVAGNVVLANKGWTVGRVVNANTFVFYYPEVADTTVAFFGGNATFWSSKIQQEGLEGGEGLLVDNCSFLWCGNALASKRGAIGTTVRNCHARYVGNGFRSSIVSGPTGGSHFNIESSSVKFCEGVPFEVHGPNCTVINCRAVNYAKTFVLNATTGQLTGTNGYRARSVNNPSPISGLNALSATGLKVLGFTAVQEGSWKAGVDPEPAKTPCGIFIGNQPIYAYGTTGAFITGLRTDGINRPFEEFPTRSANNVVGSITAANYTKDSIIQDQTRQALWLQNGRLDLDDTAHARTAQIHTLAGSSVGGWSSRATSNNARIHASFETTNGVAGGIGTEAGGITFNYGPSMVRYLYLNVNGLVASRPITFTPTAANATPNSSVFLDSSNDRLTEPKPREITVTFKGSCQGNPGPGSWKAHLWEPATGKQDTARGEVPDTTNNRMELTAALQGIKRVKAGANVTMVGSQYVVRGMTEWLAKWQANGWRKGGGGRVEHRELWEALIEAVKRHQRVMWRAA